MKKDIIVIGPKPPAIGGIASIVLLLQDGLKNENITFIDTRKPENIIRHFWALFLLFKIMFSCALYRPEKVLLFSSAYLSFWEKCFWGKIIEIFKGHPNIVMVDGHFPEFFNSISNFKRKVAQKLVKNAYIIAQSKKWADFYTSIFPGTVVKQITGGVDTEFFNSKNNEVKNNKDNKIDILFVGWIIKEKGVLDLINSIQILIEKKRHENIRLRLVGPLYMDYDELVVLINNKKLSKFVEIVGPVRSKEKILNELISADIFVFPSLYEGFPVALLEALSCGLPCVGTDVGGIPDIIINGENGFIVPPNNSEKLAEALQYLVSSKDLRIKMGRYSRKYALEKYTYTSCINSYQSVLGITSL